VGGVVEEGEESTVLELPFDIWQIFYSDEAILEFRIRVRSWWKAKVVVGRFECALVIGMQTGAMKEKKAETGGTARIFESTTNPKVRYCKPAPCPARLFQEALGSQTTR